MKLVLFEIALRIMRFQRSDSCESMSVAIKLMVHHFTLLFALAFLIFDPVIYSPWKYCRLFEKQFTAQISIIFDSIPCPKFHFQQKMHSIHLIPK